MRRRDLIAMLVGVAAASPLTVRAQTRPMPVVGFLSTRSQSDMEHLSAAFLRGMAEAGYVEGRDVVVEYRFADQRYDALPAMATELVRRGVAAIFTGGGPPPARAAMAATTTIPIVFATGGDPVFQGLVTHLNRPGANVTGVTMLLITLNAKRLEVLQELLPNASTLAMLANPDFSGTDEEVTAVDAAARAHNRRLVVVMASNASEIETGFATAMKDRSGGLVVSSEPFLSGQIGQIVALAARHGLPAIYPWRDFVAAGGLISYGPNPAEAYRLAGNYVAKILSGIKPGDLPVVQSSKFEFVINLKTAKALGLTIPPTLLARADEVIE